MEFELTEDRQMLSDTLMRYAGQYCNFEKSRQQLGERAESARLHWQRLAQLGALAALFPEQSGGLAGQGEDITTVFECIGKGLVPGPLLSTLVCGRAIEYAGQPAHHEILKSMIAGNTIAVFAHDEPDNHYEEYKVGMRAIRSDGGWVLSGTKAVVRHADQADYLLVSARTQGQDDEQAGISLFCVAVPSSGLVVCTYPTIDGASAADIEFDQVFVPDSGLLGKEHDGAAILAQACGWGVLALCAEALGLMETVKLDTLDYLRTRKQFGVPLSDFQSLQHRMVDMTIEMEQARSAVLNAAFAIDHTNEPRQSALSAAKYTIGRVGELVAQEGIQMHGGIGMTDELRLSHYARRLIMIDHQFGDMDHHLSRYLQLTQSLALLPDKQC